MGGSEQLVAAWSAQPQQRPEEHEERGRVADKLADLLALGWDTDDAAHERWPEWVEMARITYCLLSWKERTMWNLPNLPTAEQLARGGFDTVAKLRDMTTRDVARISSLNGFVANSVLRRLRSISPMVVLDLHGLSALTSLPDVAITLGHVSLRDCPNLDAFPRSWDIRGDLEVKGCERLASLPALQLGGSLVCTDCDSLLEILVRSVKSNLRVERCRSLVQVSPTRVGLTLYMLKCHAIEEISAPACTVGKSMHVAECDLLRSIRLGAVTGDVYLDHLDALTSLVVKESIGGGLRMKELASLTTLPSTLTVLGKVELRGVRNLSSLGKSFKVLSLQLSHCHALEDLPKHLRVERDLTIEACRSFRHAHPTVSVGQDIKLHTLPALDRLPPSFRNANNLTVHRCERLASFPTSMAVRGRLDLADCPALAALPDDLAVGSHVTISTCDSLHGFPMQHVRGHLSVTRCAALTSLHPDLAVDGNLSVENCPSLAALPDSVFDLGESPLTADGVHRVAVAGSAVDLAAARRRLEGRSRHVQVTWDPAAVTDDAGGEPGGVQPERMARGPGELVLFRTVEEACQFWADAAGEEEAVRLEVDVQHRRSLLLFLSKLRTADEFRDEGVRGSLAGRVTEVLRLLAGEEDSVREELYARISNSVISCVDNVLSALNQIMVHVLVSKVRNDREGLRSLGRRVLRLHKVHERAAQTVAKLSSRGSVDELEVFLKYEVLLRADLDLPVGVTKMNFEDVHSVSARSLQIAKQEALDVSEEEFEAWLADWEPWRRLLRWEAAQSMQWSRLKRNSQRWSLSFRNVCDEAIDDPVRVGGRGGPVWSMRDLVRHWVEHGRDFNNVPRDVDDMLRSVTRVGS